VKYSAGPLPEGWEPLRLISICFLLRADCRSICCVSCRGQRDRRSAEAGGVAVYELDAWQHWRFKVDFC